MKRLVCLIAAAAAALTAFSQNGHLPRLSPRPRTVEGVAAPVMTLNGTGKSNFTYRPFTLEGNFAFAAGIQEMLLQSHTGTVRIFPAIPASWHDVSFRQLRAQGAFLISATRERGKVTAVRIDPPRGGTIRLADPFPTDAAPRIAGAESVSRQDGV